MYRNKHPFFSEKNPGAIDSSNLTFLVAPNFCKNPNNIEEISLEQFEEKFKITYSHETAKSENFTLPVKFAEHASTLQPIPSRDEIEKKYKLLANPEKKLIIAYLSKSTGYGIFSKCDIPNNTIICTYAGIIYNFDNSAEGGDYNCAVILPCPNNISLICNPIQYTAGITSAKQGNLSRFFQHLPKSEPLYSEIIATENLTFVEAFDKQKNVPLLYAITNRDIKAGEQLGFDYGKEYWQHKSVAPEQFTLDGKILPPQLLYKELGNNCFRKEKFQDALSFYERAIKIEPTLKEACLNAALCYCKLNKQPMALKVLEEALKIDPKYTKAVYHKANILYLQEQYDDASNAINAYLKVGGKNHKAILALQKKIEQKYLTTTSAEDQIRLTLNKQ